MSANIKENPMMPVINLRRILPTNISTNPLIKTKAAVEKLLGRIKAQIKSKGPNTYRAKSLKLCKYSLCMLICLAM